MIRIAVSQRVIVLPHQDVRGDCLDHDWWSFLCECGIYPVIIPNHAETARRILDSTPIAGILLTGGNDLLAYGGDAPERDETESLLLNFSIERSLPLLGVCRGMQFIQHQFGVPLSKIDGHVAVSQTILYKDSRRTVNSYHVWGSKKTVPELEVFAVSLDGVTKAICHSNQLIIGIMWHPERCKPIDPEDKDLFQSHFNTHTIL